MKLFTLLIITSLNLWPGIGSAELYKWTDEAGSLHITDAPPPELQKKSGPAVRPAPRSTLPRKATAKPMVPELSRAEVRLAPEPPVTPHLSNDLAVQPKMEGLTPDRATLMSAWQTFDGAQSFAKAPVQRWKDERGVEHFVDVLPAATHAAEGGTIPNRNRPKTP